MPVMRRLHVGGTTYDTVGEASVTQVQTSGTKIATVSIDGTTTDIYAPEGGGSLVVPTYTVMGETTATCDMTFAQVLAAVEDGTCTYAVIAGDGIAVYMLSYGDDYISFSSNYISSSIMTISIEHDASGIAYATSTLALPSASSTAPSMDGTAAVGSSAKYAREDHVHPTDTSRQATLVSGTNIKTVMGASLLGSGNVAMPTASTSTLGGVKVDGTTITAAADGTISASGGSGGSTLTLYTSDLYSMYFDSAYTTQFNSEYFDYDFDAEWAALSEPDTVNIVYIHGSDRAVCPVICRYRDTQEDGMDIYFAYKSTIRSAGV